MKTLEDSIAWQKSRILVNAIYQSFYKIGDWIFYKQIYRAALSTMNNIAEGLERNSNKELLYFLNVSKGSCGEVRSMLYVAKDQNKITQEDFWKLFNQSKELSKVLSGFMKSINAKA
ncbi:four helix bundle protein [Candidatus Uhrbacteria bacterium]|jgi:four helix bundle protein|nr:four helix bundle protein [Candidatus Uhrbacteria bacterium]MBT7717254.1 four helix bundle protein [Candidatus Uhrbacteria bacterium]